jgi:hypothetical protein
MKLLDVPLGLLFNFLEIRLIDGLSRLILPGANPPGTKGNKGNEEGAERSAGLRRGEARKHIGLWRSLRDGGETRPGER